MANFEYRGRIDLDEYLKGDSVNDITCWPRIMRRYKRADDDGSAAKEFIDGVIATGNLFAAAAKDVDAAAEYRKSMSGLRPRFSDTFPKGLVELLVEACEGAEESRKIIYGFIHDGRFDCLETRKEPLAKLPNLRPLSDLYPRLDACEEGYGEFKMRLLSIERDIELNMVGPAGMTADLNRYVSRKSTRELNKGWVPIYARITTRPAGPAPEEEGLRPHEERLHDFLTTAYREAGVIAIDRTVDKLDEVFMWVAWNWLSPPVDHPVGPELQVARFMPNQRDFKTWRMPGEPDEEFNGA